MNILDHYDILMGHGFKIIPLISGTKRPICKDWTTPDTEFNRNIIQKNRDCNLGLLLGEIIDVEGDTKHANDLIDHLVDGYRHPVYTSQKSRHHLFISPDPSFRILKFEGIEFRGDRHQSVLPPSIVNGVQYVWENNMLFEPVPPMPDRLISFFRKIKNRKHSIKPGYMRLYCAVCGEACFIHKKRFDLELRAFKQMKQRWQCHLCRQSDLRESCRSLRKQLRRDN